MSFGSWPAVVPGYGGGADVGGYHIVGPFVSGARGVLAARLVVSEPIGDLPGAWIEMPEASYGVIGQGDDRLLPFAVQPPPKAL